MASFRALFSNPTAVRWGIALLLLHTLLVLRTVWFCYVNRGVGQVELAWILFWIVDFPFFEIFDWLRATALIDALFDLGYRLIGSGPNLSLSVYTAIVGGAQWYLIGSLIGGGISRLIRR